MFVFSYDDETLKERFDLRQENSFFPELAGNTLGLLPTTNTKLLSRIAVIVEWFMHSKFYMAEKNL